MARFVLVHGAWHGAWCYDALARDLAAAGHEVDTFDLPGHGADTTPHDAVTLDAYAQRVAEVIGEEASSFQVEDLHLGWRSGTSLGTSKDLLELYGGRAQYRIGHGMLLWDGACIVHDEFKGIELELLRREHPDAQVLVHPESPASVVAQADVVGSTTQLLKAVVDASPAGRLGDPEEIAAMVVFLCGDGGKYMTGQTIAIDGGWTAQ